MNETVDIRCTGAAAGVYNEDLWRPDELAGSMAYGDHRLGGLLMLSYRNRRCNYNGLCETHFPNRRCLRIRRASAAVPPRGEERPVLPAAITHPEYYYGFIGVAVAWQIGFLVLAKDPVRYRAMMIPAIIEKATFGIAVGVLFALNRASLPMLGFGFVDLIFGALFVVAYIRTPASWR